MRYCHRKGDDLVAILQATVFSRALNRTVPITVILPSDKYDWDGNAMAKPPFQTL